MGVQVFSEEYGRAVQKQLDAYRQTPFWQVVYSNPYSRSGQYLGEKQWEKPRVSRFSTISLPLYLIKVTPK